MCADIAKQKTGSKKYQNKVECARFYHVYCSVGIRLRLVAAGTVVRSHDLGDVKPIVLERGGVVRVRFVTGVAIHAYFGVSASAPLLHRARVLLL